MCTTCVIEMLGYHQSLHALWLHYKTLYILQGELSDIDSTKGGDNNSDFHGSSGFGGSTGPSGGFHGGSGGFGGPTGPSGGGFNGGSGFGGPTGPSGGGNPRIGFENYDNPGVSFPQMPSVPGQNAGLAYPPPQVILQKRFSCGLRDPTT